MNLKSNLKQILMLCILLPGPELTAQYTVSENALKYVKGYASYFTQIDAFGPAFELFSDQEGYIYISGNTRDPDYPVSENAYQKELKGEADAFVAKFTPEGALVFSTLIGGSSREHHTGLTVDEEGNVYLVGGTHSSDFPVTPDSYDIFFNGEKDWGGDVFLVKLNPSGTHLEFATFIGGLAQETADVVHVDSEGNILIGGCTRSPDFPVTEGAIDKEFRGFEAFISKFSADGKELLFSTFLGGSGNDAISCITTDPENNIYAAGFTRSNDLPVTANALRKSGENTEESEWWDGTDNYLVKLNKDGTRRLYSSYIGGKSRPIESLGWYPPNILLVAGNTNSESFPVTRDALYKDYQGDRDGFISLFNAESLEPEYSTLIGGSGYDFIRAAFLLDHKQIVFAGETNSPDFPLTDAALDTVYPVSDSTYNSGFFGNRKFFISVLDIENKQLRYSSFYYGGKRFSIYPDGRGNLGYIGETGIPVTENALVNTPTSLIMGRLELKK